MRAICGLTLAVLLSGCWTGPDFYAERSSEQPIEPGRYKLVDTYAMLPDAQEKLWREEPIGYRVRISYADDGTAIVENAPAGEGPQRARIVALDKSRGLYVAQIDPGEGVAEVGTRIYGLISVGSGGYRISIPPCDGTRRLTPNSPVIVGGVLFGLRCRFRTRAEFETAMLAFARDPVSWSEYRRVTR